MRFPSFGLRVLFGVVTVAACCAGLFTWAWRADWEYYEYQSFDCGQSRRIVISNATFWEQSQPYYYEVFDHSIAIVRKTGFDSLFPGDDDPEYQLVTAENGELVAIYDRNRPYEFLVVHDFSKGTSWQSGDRSDLGLRRRMELERPDLSRSAKLRDRKYLNSTDWVILSDAGIVNEDLANLYDIDTIRVLHLDGNQITDDGLKHLVTSDGLRVLVLSNNNLSGIGLNYLAPLKLDRLDLGDTELSDAALFTISQLRTLSTLNISNTAIENEDLFLMLGSLTELRLLDLRGTKVSPESVKKLQLLLPNTHIER